VLLGDAVSAFAGPAADHRDAAVPEADPRTRRANRPANRFMVQAGVPVLMPAPPPHP
jgi:hypothetical protein